MSWRIAHRYVIPVAGAALIVFGALGISFQLSSDEGDDLQAGLGGGEGRQVANLDEPIGSQVEPVQSILEPSETELQPVRIRVEPEVIEGGADALPAEGSGDAFPLVYTLLVGVGIILLVYPLARARVRLLRAGLGVLFLAFLVAAFGGSSSTTVLAEDATITRWGAGSQKANPPVSVLRAPDGTIWYAAVLRRGSVPAHIGRLDPVTNTRTTWALPLGGNKARGVALDTDGNVWFATSGHIGRLEPATNFFTIWGVPNNCCTVRTEVIFDSTGKLWFAGDNNIALRFNPSTNVLTKWSLPGPFGAFMEDMETDSVGAFWFLFSDTVLRLDPSTNVATSWTGIGFVHSFSLDPSGFVWVSRPASNLFQLSRLDTAANTVTRWSIGDGMVPSGIAVAADGRVYFGEYDPTNSSPDKPLGIGRLDPAASTFVEWQYATIRFFSSDVPDLSCRGGRFNRPMAGCMLKFDAAGDLWFVDSGLARIGRLSLVP